MHYKPHSGQRYRCPGRGLSRRRPASGRPVDSHGTRPPCPSRPPPARRPPAAPWWWDTVERARVTPRRSARRLEALVRLEGEENAPPVFVTEAARSARISRHVQGSTSSPVFRADNHRYVVGSAPGECTSSPPDAMDSCGASATPVTTTPTIRGFSGGNGATPGATQRTMFKAVFLQIDRDTPSALDRQERSGGGALPAAGRAACVLPNGLYVVFARGDHASVWSTMICVFRRRVPEDRLIRRIVGAVGLPILTSIGGMLVGSSWRLRRICLHFVHHDYGYRRARLTASE